MARSATSPKQCIASCTDGQACRGVPVAGSQHCTFHDPDKADRVASGRATGGERRSRPRAVVPDSAEDIEVRNAQDVCRLLSVTINDVRKGRLDPKVANTVGYLAGVLVRAIEVGDLEERLAMLEAAVKRPALALDSFNEELIGGEQ